MSYNLASVLGAVLIILPGRAALTQSKLAPGQIPVQFRLRPTDLETSFIVSEPRYLLTLAVTRRNATLALGSLGDPEPLAAGRHALHFERPLRIDPAAVAAAPTPDCWQRTLTSSGQLETGWNSACGLTQASTGFAERQAAWRPTASTSGADATRLLVLLLVPQPPSDAQFAAARSATEGARTLREVRERVVQALTRSGLSPQWAEVAVAPRGP
jgi:hypothetical protein